MLNRYSLLIAAVLLVALAVGGPSRSRGEDDPTKVPDARQTTESFLAAALSGRAKEAAVLGEPGKAYSREEKIKEITGLGVEKLALARVLADDQYALVITENVVEPKRRQEGPLSIRLVKKDNRWLIRDVDFGKEQAAKNVQRFQRERPKAKVVIPKGEK